jgi:hypothetical protein
MVSQEELSCLILSDGKCDRRLVFGSCKFDNRSRRIQLDYIKYGIIGLVVLLLSGCSGVISAGQNMEDAKKAVAEGKVNDTGPMDLTALKVAAKIPNNIEIITYLLENGAEISVDNCKSSAIKTAIGEEYTSNQYKNKLILLDNIELLLKYATKPKHQECKDQALLLCDNYPVRSASINLTG